MCVENSESKAGRCVKWLLNGQEKNFLFFDGG